MKKIIATTKFRKDYKRYRNQPDKIAKLHAVVKMLEEGKQISLYLKPHQLTGEYKGCLECHIENDLLLIWMDYPTNTISLIRFGTHSELF
ncbi:MAG: type II toxin-antitoxin system YafQ family toxin [Tannerella sp.]|jgi:mRNA interferase YafQ|nr:type II toxin-antitoxin system YafQ family toxin [Tannerella sp.]